MPEESKCPVCGNPTVSSVAFDNACTQCDYVEETYPNADFVGYYEAQYGSDD